MSDSCIYAPKAILSTVNAMKKQLEGLTISFRALKMMINLQNDIALLLINVSYYFYYYFRP